MAFLKGIFSSKRTQRSLSKERNDQINKNVTPKLDKSKIRLVICADSERARTPYFDSNAIRLVEETEKNVTKTAPKSIFTRASTNSGHNEPPLPQHRQGPKYDFQKLGTDVEVIGEMMFGTGAMAFESLNVKVHLMRSPPQLMVSEVFIPEKSSRDGAVDSESESNILSGSSADYLPGEFSLSSSASKSNDKYAKSFPVDVPAKDVDNSTDDDNGLASFTASGSQRTSFPSPNTGSFSSYNSLHRRWMRAQTTSLNVQHRRDGGTLSESTVPRPHRRKLAIGIIFGSHDEKDDESIKLFQSFFFSHFALIEGHVEKLRSVVEKSYFNPRIFLPAVMEALETFRNDIHDLYMAPRLSEPVWLTMISTTTYKMKLCEKFMDTFKGLVNKYNNKNCKFFVSTLLSAVLTQHVAWVTTVIPTYEASCSTYQGKLTAKWVDTLAKSHPYNPLWAQLGDMFGAVGCPLKISRTIVTGKKADIVQRFLYILSYFIRCSEVQENTYLQCLSSIVSSTQFEVISSPTPSEKTLSDGLEQSISPGDGASLLKQASTSSGDESGLVDHIVNGKIGSREYKHQKQAVLMEKETTDSVKHYCKHQPVDSHTEHYNESQNMDLPTKLHNEPPNVDSPTELYKTSTNFHNKQCFERSDSGYNGANFESSSEQDTVLINGVDCNNVQGRTSEVNKYSAQVNFASNSTNNVLCGCSQQFSHSNSEQLEFSIEHDHACQPRKDTSSIESQPSSSVAPANELIAMSELHNHGPQSFPMCRVTSSIVPSDHRIGLTGSAAAPCNQIPLELGAKACKSEGKTISRLTQQLSTSGENSNEAETNGDLSSVGLALSIPSFPYDSKDKLESLNKLLISRPVQISQDFKASSSKGTLLSNSRSITPTELSRRRHLSSSTNIDYETFDPMVHCKEIKLPNSLAESGQWHVKAFDSNFGHSLLADYTDHYMPDFILHGTSDTNFKSRLLNDLQMSVRHSVLDEPVREAVCVIADTDNWTVEVASSTVLGLSPSGCTSWSASKMVADMIESVVQISRLKMNAEFCLMHLEDRLQEIYFKSMILSENLHSARNYSQLELTELVGCESSDIPLLRAVATAHTPSLACGLK